MYDLERLQVSCPMDGSVMKRLGNSLVCEHKHTYDISRHGYVNLLPVQFKRSLQPGDNESMVQARNAFLSSGLYAIVSETICDLVSICLKERRIKSPVLIDAGCGEGYYTDQLYRRLTTDSAFSSVDILGFDISKEAIKTASKRNKNVFWCVATNTQIPQRDSSADVVLSLFGNPVEESFYRVLISGGLLIVANAGPRHLIELRERIYPQVHFKPVNTGICMDGFPLRQIVSLHKSRQMTRDQIELLLKMTPHFYRADKEKLADLLANPPKEVSIDIRCTCYTALKDGRS